MTGSESGSALLVALITLLMLSFLGLFIAFSANTNIQISDNYESQIQATYAALAGLNHARVLMRGMDFDDVLKGPDGTYDGNSSYIAQARQYEFRNPLPLTILYGLAISNPVLSGVPDDGIISTGFCGGAAGTALIPIAGIGLSADDPYRAGQIVTARYFVKVTDNSGEASELSGDPGDDPFTDGDGIVIVRSAGLSKTFFEKAGLIPRLNSVAVFEARYKKRTTFEAGPALVVLASDIVASFSGNYEISGGAFAGVGTIDTDISDASFPDQLIALAAGAGAPITGGGLADPSIQDISVEIFAGRDKSMLMNPRFLWEFINVDAPKYADFYYSGNQNWDSGTAPVSFYDISKNWNEPGQNPKLIVVNGDLQVSGDYSGGGLLLVKGTLSYAGQFSFNGLVLVIGSGKLVADAGGAGIQGGVIVSSLAEQNGNPVFGTPEISLAGDSRVAANRNAVKMASGLMPVSQVSFREIAGSDP